MPYVSDGKWGYARYGTKDLVIEAQFSDYRVFSNDLAAVSSSNKCGFVDHKGFLVVSMVYDYFHNFDEGLAAIQTDWKLGFINIKGETIIRCQYDFVSDFHNGFAVVGKFCDETSKLDGLVDQNGEEQIPLIYSSLLISGKLLLAGLKGKYGVIDNQNKVVLPFSFDRAEYISGLFKFKSEVEHLIIDNQGNTLFHS